MCALQTAIPFVSLANMYVLFRFIAFFFLNGSFVIALPARADQKCMRWMESEGFQRRVG